MGDHLCSSLKPSVRGLTTLHDHMHLVGVMQHSSFGCPRKVCTQEAKSVEPSDPLLTLQHTRSSVFPILHIGVSRRVSSDGESPPNAGSKFPERSVSGPFGATAPSVRHRVGMFRFFTINRVARAAV
jgi:hypothetical protein